MTPSSIDLPAGADQLGRLKEKEDNDSGVRESKKLYGDYFGRLPPEIREMIWQYFVSKLFVELDLTSGNPVGKPHPTSPSNAPGILRVNRSISNEVVAYLYHEPSLHLVLDPSKNRWAPRGPKAQQWPLENAQLSRFRVLWIHVFEPNVRNDPGQLCQLLESTIDLACFLSGRTSVLHGEEQSYTSFDRIGILLRDLANHGSDIHRLWSQVPKLPPIRLIFHDRFEPPWESNIYERNRKMILRRVFMLLRWVATLRLSDIKDDPGVKGHASHDYVKAFLQQLEYSLDPKRITWREYLSNLFLSCATLDYMLDELPGPTAANLRLLRFEDWLFYEAASRRYSQLLGLDRVRRAYEFRQIWYLLFRNYCLFKHRSSLAGLGRGKAPRAEMLDGKAIWRHHFPHGIAARRSQEARRQMRMCLDTVRTPSREEVARFADIL
ncbi:MAG: hypothetical protein LQ352_005334 [Teloschistes flavicans]|nr:MAG: hypothetical protein LQ352_005334 [Teloschistes flavicans]